MSPTSQPNSDPRSLIRYGSVALAATIVLLWAVYLVRAPLLMIYVSALFATGCLAYRCAARNMGGCPDGDQAENDPDHKNDHEAIKPA